MISRQCRKAVQSWDSDISKAGAKRNAGENIAGPTIT